MDKHKEGLTTGEWIWFAGFAFNLGIRLGQIQMLGPGAVSPFEGAMFFVAAIGTSLGSGFAAGLALGNPL